MARGHVAAILSAFAAWPAMAQEPLLFSEDNYGKVNKTFQESSHNQAMLEVLMNKQDVFEAVADLHERDRYRMIGRSVGMLDMRVQGSNGQRGNSVCTATLISPDRAITNHHCIPGGRYRTISAQLRLGYLDRSGSTGETFPVSVQPIESNQGLDYAIFAVSGVPTDRYPPAKIAPRDISDRESLFLVHHPAGEPQTLTRRRCQAGTPAINADTRLVHHCDTLGGSSGTVIFAETDGSFAGVHHTGVPDRVRPFNMGTPSAAIVSASPELRRILTATAPRMEPPPEVRAQTAPPFSVSLISNLEVRAAVIEARRVERLARQRAAEARDAAKKGDEAAVRARAGEAGTTTYSGNNVKDECEGAAQKCEGFGVRYSVGPENFGNVYRGQFAGDKNQGFAVYEFADNENNRENRLKKAEAFYVDGSREGAGFLEWQRGDTFFGEFVAGKRLGSGVYRWPNGARREGEWMANNSNGLGVEWAPDGSIRSVGRWENDNLVEAMK